MGQTSPPRLRSVAGGATLLAGLMHGVLAPEHFAEWWGYGLVFSAAALGQVVGALAVLGDAFGRGADPRLWPLDRRVLAGLLALNLALVALYAVTRIWGVPWLGPEAWVPEDVAPADLATKGLELLAAAALARHLWTAPGREAAAAGVASPP